MTEEQKKLIDQYIEKEEIEIPDMTPTKKELENPVPVLKELPMKQEAIPKAVSWEFFWNTGITTIINSVITAFGFGLCAQRDSEGKVVNVYPARTNFRGLTEASTSIGLEHFGRFLAENAKLLYDESYVAERTLLEAAEAYQEELKQTAESETPVETTENVSPIPMMAPDMAMYPEIRQESYPGKSSNKKTSRFLRERLESQGVDVDAILEKNSTAKEIPDNNPPTATFSVSDEVEQASDESETPSDSYEMPTGIVPDDSNTVEVDSLP